MTTLYMIAVKGANDPQKMYVGGRYAPVSCQTTQQMEWNSKHHAMGRYQIPVQSQIDMFAVGEKKAKVWTSEKSLRRFLNLCIKNGRQHAPALANVQHSFSCYRLIEIQDGKTTVRPLDDFLK